MNNFKKVLRRFSGMITPLTAIVAILSFFAVAAPAFAGVAGSVGPTYPTTVNVGDTNIPVNIQIVNNSTPPQNTENILVTSVSHTPSCGSGNNSTCSPADSDPGVFEITGPIVGHAGTGCAGINFTAGIPDPVTGEIQFTPNNPVILASSLVDGALATCTVDFHVNVLKAPVKDANLITPEIQTAQLARVNFTAQTSQVNGSASGSSEVAVIKASPTIETVPSAGGAIGTILNDTATLSGGSNPTGDVTFKLFAPSDPVCLTPIFTYFDNSAPYATSVGYTSLVAGTYRWTADYVGDVNNNAASSGCQEEQVVIVPNGNIIIDKITNPSGDSQSFDFVTTGTGYNNFSLTDIASPNNQELNAGTYSVSETSLLGWDQTSATCVSSNLDIETPENISLQAGETITCTFTNGKIPTLTLEKIVVNDNGGTAIESNFQAYIDTEAVSWNDPQTLDPGTYTAGEDVVAGYTAGAWGGDCDINGSVTLGYGDNKTCTITNNDTPSYIIVDKTVINDNGGTAVANDFLLTVDGNAVSDEIAYAVNPGAHTVGETLLSGYTAGAWGGDCDVNAGVTVALGETKTCTITNNDILRTGNITVDKVTLPGSDPQNFSFDASGGTYADFSLTDIATPNNQELVAGTYSITEILPSGWTQTSATCSDGSLISAIDLSAGETIMCTFTNTKLNPDIDVEKYTNGQDADTPTGPIVTEGDPIAWTYVVTNTGDVTLTDILVTDDKGVTVTCPKNTLAMGESMTCTANGIAIVGQYSNIGSVDGYYENILVEDSDPSHYYGEKKDIQYCSPGYWKQSQHFGSWIGYSPDQKFSDVFGENITIMWSAKGKPSPVSNPTLLQALEANGGEVNMLARVAVDALLNASALNTELTPAEVIAEFQAVYPGTKSDYQAFSIRFSTPENCPLGNTGTIVPPIVLLGTLSAEDFGVVNYDTGLGWNKGYTAGFSVADNTLAGATSVVVKLYAAGDVLLQTNTAILSKFNTDITGTQFSSPFDVSGTFDYGTDGYWINTRESQYGQSIPATKVVATVTLANSKVVTATNTNLTGDPTTIYPVDMSPDWDASGTYILSFEYQNGFYPHDMTLAQDGSGNLTGNGGSPAGANVYTWVLTSGTVTGNSIDFYANYTATADAVSPQTVMHVVGTIAPDGTMSGTWSDNYQGGQRTGTWSTTTGTATAV